MTTPIATIRIPHSQCFGSGGKGTKFRTTRYPDFTRQWAANAAYFARLKDIAAAAAKRVAVAAERSPQEKLDLLDQRLGKNVGAHAERRKLLALIATNKGAEAKAVAPTTEEPPATGNGTIKRKGARK